MSFSNSAMLVGGNAIRAALGGMQLHADNPGVGGAANNSSAGMQVPTWSTVTGSGNFGLAAPVAFTGGTANGPCTYVSLWSNATGSGTWYGNFALSGDLTFDSNGDYTVETLDLTGYSS